MRQCRENSVDRPRYPRDSGNDASYSYSGPHPAHPDPVSCREWGWRRAGIRGGLCQGCWGPPESPSLPGGQCPSQLSMPGARSHLGCLQEPVLAQAWVSGLSWRAGLLLLATGPASAPLPRVRAEQGCEGAIRWGATPLHLEVGSQGSVLAGAPLRRGQGI